MTRHADLGRGQSSEGGLLDASVAIATINPQPAHVVLMTERHWLIQRCVYVRPKIRPGISEDRGRESEQNQRNTNNHRTRNGIRSFLEKLAHSDEGAVRPSPIESQPRIGQTCHNWKELQIRERPANPAEIINSF